MSQGKKGKAREELNVKLLKTFKVKKLRSLELTTTWKIPGLPWPHPIRCCWFRPPRCTVLPWERAWALLPTISKSRASMTNKKRHYENDELCSLSYWLWICQYSDSDQPDFILTLSKSSWTCDRVSKHGCPVSFGSAKLVTTVPTGFVRNKSLRCLMAIIHDASTRLYSFSPGLNREKSQSSNLIAKRCNDDLTSFANSIIVSMGKKFQSKVTY